MAGESTRGVRRVIEVLAVLALLVLGASVLLPSLSRARKMAYLASMRSEPSQVNGDYNRLPEPNRDKPLPPLARVKTFVAGIDLTPRLSVGTSEPESIYEAKFRATIQAAAPERGQRVCRIELPLPPQIISLSDLDITAAGEPSSEDVQVDGSRLVWQGELDETPRDIEVTYAAVGKGIYTLDKPSGRIIDRFETTLTANGSDVRMLELSLQPQKLDHQAGKTVYQWTYERLMIARPIALDVLGIAPMDKLGELTWLGPVSVLVFGLLASLVVLAYRPEKLDGWMLLLLAGTFMAAYPLMYFAQELMPLNTAVLVCGVAMIVIIAVRSATLLGLRVGLAGMTLLAAGFMALTLLATTQARYRGLLLTVMMIVSFLVAMVLLPRARKAFQSIAPSPPPMPQP